MNAVEQARSEELYLRQRVDLKLQGKRPKMIEGYGCAVRPVAGRLDRCSDELTLMDLRAYVAGRRKLRRPHSHLFHQNTRLHGANHRRPASSGPEQRRVSVSPARTPDPGAQRHRNARSSENH
jgi:hypothetical protein